MKKTSFFRRIFSLILASVFLIISFPITSNAATHEPVTCYVSTSTVYSNNIHENAYSSTSKVSNSYMCSCPDGTVARVENFGDVILIERYNSSFQLAAQGTVPFELSKFGGFYAGSRYNYLVFGQDNPNQASDREIVRIVRYTKNWQRVDSASLYDCDSREIFTMCNTSISEANGFIYFRMGHKAYLDSKGVSKQSAMTIAYNESTGKITSANSAIGTADTGNIENIGATYIDANAGKVSFVDESLTNPYCLILSRFNGGIAYNTPNCGATFLAKLGAREAQTSNIPEFSIGGLVSSSQYYLAVGASAPLDGTSTNKNVFVEAIPRNSFNYNSIKISYLTGFAHGDAYTATTPYIVKISNDLFMVLWEKRYGYSDTATVSYTFINGNGNRVGEEKTINGCLSDCQPIIYNGKVVWYTTDGKSVRVYTVPVQVTTNNQTDTSVYSTNTVYNGVDYAAIYDYNYYMNKYPDMRVLYTNNPDGALQHFLTKGILEGRQAHPNFNVYAYANNYPDLRAAFGNNLPQYYQHYLVKGFAEGRNAVAK